MTIASMTLPHAPSVLNAHVFRPIPAVEELALIFWGRVRPFNPEGLSQDLPTVEPEVSWLAGMVTVLEDGVLIATAAIPGPTFTRLSGEALGEDATRHRTLLADKVLAFAAAERSAVADLHSLQLAAQEGTQRADQATLEANQALTRHDLHLEACLAHQKAVASHQDYLMALVMREMNPAQANPSHHLHAMYRHARVALRPVEFADFASRIAAVATRQAWAATATADLCRSTLHELAHMGALQAHSLAVDARVEALKTFKEGDSAILAQKVAKAFHASMAERHYDALASRMFTIRWTASQRPEAV